MMNPATFARAPRHVNQSIMRSTPRNVGPDTYRPLYDGCFEPKTCTVELEHLLGMQEHKRKLFVALETTPTRVKDLIRDDDSATARRWDADQSTQGYSQLVQSQELLERCCSANISLQEFEERVLGLSPPPLETVRHAKKHWSRIRCKTQVFSALVSPKRNVMRQGFQALEQLDQELSPPPLPHWDAQSIDSESSSTSSNPPRRITFTVNDDDP